MDNQPPPPDDSSYFSDSELDESNAGRERPAPDDGSTAVYPLPDYIIAYPPSFEAEKEDLTGIIKPKYEPAPKLIIGAMFFKPRCIRDLQGFGATRLSFKAPDEVDEIKDGWFELALSDLSDEVRDCARSCFKARNDYPPAYRRSPWRDGLPRQLIDYASLVARGDPLRGGWDGLLRGHLARVCLCAGILSKILERNVFDKHLFGASESQEKLLTDLDIELVGEEGYRRTAQRADIVRSLLPDPNQLPPRFWDDVDRIALQITQLFIPLVNLDGRVYRDANWKSTREMYQGLHDIVAKAGFIANMMRRSATIFRIEFPAPGELSTLDLEEVATQIYKDSKAASDAKQGAGPAGAGAPNPPAGAGPPPLEYRARVQIVVWPAIKRFRPIGLRGAGASMGATRGESISRLTRAQCAYHSGPAAESVYSPERTPLQAHIASLEWEGLRLRRQALGRGARAAGRKARRVAGLVVLPAAALLVFLAFLAAYLEGYRPSDIRIPDRLREAQWPRRPRLPALPPTGPNWRALLPWRDRVVTVTEIPSGYVWAPEATTRAAVKPAAEPTGESVWVATATAATPYWWHGGGWLGGF